jgi:nicotinate-nucleotide--dimethylbenzimidazole phosphoribosyltransferase
MTLPDPIAALLDRIRQVTPAAADAARTRYDVLIKPPGSLGRLEAVGGRLAAIAGRCPPPVPEHPAVVVAAADHGVHAQGVSGWPQQVTTIMVEQFCAGTAAVNAIARTVAARVAVLDVGCATEPADHPLLRKRRVRAATADLTRGPAMSGDEAVQAVLAGAALVDDVVADGADLIVTGDMGISNTTASACLIAALTGAGAEQVAGRGAGGDDRMVAHKREVIAAALETHAAVGRAPLPVLAALGGLEHAALAGVICAAAARRVPVLLDGVISNAAAAVAVALCPTVVDYLIASHRSAEPGASIALGHLGLDPLLDLGLRLGEGTGGLLAVPLVQAAARTLAEMATLEDLGLG